MENRLNRRNYRDASDIQLLNIPCLRPDCKLISHIHTFIHQDSSRATPYIAQIVRNVATLLTIDELLSVKATCKTTKSKIRLFVTTKTMYRVYTASFAFFEALWDVGIPTIIKTIRWTLT